MSNRVQPWPPQAVAERDAAAIALGIVLNQARRLKELARRPIIPRDSLLMVADDLADHGAEGYRYLERDEWPNIDRWPYKANAAREAAISAFWVAQEAGNRLYRIIESGRIGYYREELQDIARGLLQEGHDAAHQLTQMGAPVLFMEQPQAFDEEE